jgi:hypothetical protein
MTTKRKLPGIEVELWDGQKVTVHELRPKDMKLVLNAMPAFKEIGDAFKAAEGEVSGLPANVPDDILEKVYPLLVACTGLEEEELRENYSLGELMGFLTTFNGLLSKNLKPATPPKPEAPVSQENLNDTPSA